jgi:AraC-binding-like domain
VEPFTFGTQKLKPSNKLEAWCEWFFPAFEITPLESRHQFQAQNSLWRLGDLIVSRVVAPAVHVKRSKAHVKKASGDHWVLTYCRQGDTAVRTPKGEFTVREGVPFFWMFGDEFESQRTCSRTRSGARQDDEEREDEREDRYGWRFSNVSCSRTATTIPNGG